MEMRVKEGNCAHQIKALQVCSLWKENKYGRRERERERERERGRIEWKKMKQWREGRDLNKVKTKV